MLNNGKHYLLTFSKDVAASLGVPETGSVWPSQINNHPDRTALLMLCQTVREVDVRANCLFSVHTLLERKAVKRWDIDIEKIHVYDAESLMAKVKERIRRAQDQEAHC